MPWSLEEIQQTEMAHVDVNFKKHYKIMIYKSFVSLAHTLMYGLILSVTAYISACASTIAKEPLSVTDVKFDEVAADLRVSDNFSTVRFLQLEMTKDCVIGNIKNIIDADGHLIVITAEDELYSFNRNDGRFVAVLGNKGEGPEEYLRVAGAFYNEKDKTIDVFDDLNSKILKYTVSGKYYGNRILPEPIPMVIDAGATSEGDVLFAQRFCPGNSSSGYAFTALNSKGELQHVDPFSPLKIEDLCYTWANRPLTSTGKHISFVKFLNDTVFSLSNSEIIPSYKLSMKKRIPSKDILLQTGPFSVENYIIMCTTQGWFSGIDKIFETKKYLLLVPLFYNIDGYFWIDKENGRGFRIPSSDKTGLEIDLAIEGRSIIRVVGSNENELISSFNADPLVKHGFLKEFENCPDLEPFNDRIQAFFEKADPDGNPCIIIYEH